MTDLIITATLETAQPAARGLTAEISESEDGVGPIPVGPDPAAVTADVASGPPV